MTDFNKTDVEELPKPSGKRGNAVKLTVLTLLAVLITAAALYWLSRDEETKQELAEKVIENVDNVIKDTALEKVATYMDPPPPPIAQTPPATNNIIASTTPSTEQTQQEDENSPVVSGFAANEPAGTVAPTVEEDSMVPMTFIDDAAQWMVSRYKPGRGLRFSIAATNYRYGQTMRGLMPAGQGDVLSARAALLRYAFNTPMLTALYNLYADRFVAALGDAAEFPTKGSPLSPQHTADMYKQYAKQFQLLSAVLQGIAATPNFLEQVQQAEDLGQESVNIHSQITNAVFDLDMAREAQNQAGQDDAQARIDRLNLTYQDVLAKRKQASLGLVSTIQSKAPAARGVDADTIIFIAEWFERRQVEQNGALETIPTVANLLNDLASRLNTATNN